MPRLDAERSLRATAAPTRLRLRSLYFEPYSFKLIKQLWNCGIIIHLEVTPMHLSESIAPILKQKGGLVSSVSPSSSVYDAIAMMADKQIGALLVIVEGKIVGIVSERDYARKVILKGRSSKETTVAEIMSSPVVHISPEHSVGECMQIITKHHIRHLPVLDGQQLVGLISIGDLVNWIISAQDETIRHLEAYITGSPTTGSPTTGSPSSGSPK